jgi:hypothetical protein
VAEGGGLLIADQHFGHRRFSSQILSSQSLPRSSDLAAVGSEGLVLGADRDNFRDSSRQRRARNLPLGFQTEASWFGVSLLLRGDALRGLLTGSFPDSDQARQAWIDDAEQKG